MASHSDDPLSGNNDPSRYPQGGQYPPPGYGPPPSGHPQGGYGPPPPQGYPPAGYQQGGFGPPPPYLQPINTYLWQSIAVTLLCCLPTGIAAIVYSTRVSSLQQIGDIQGATEASQKAKKWCIISVIACIVGWVLYVLFFVVIFGAAFASLETGTTSDF